MAKEISMIQRNEKGKQAQQYFIETEKGYKKSTPAWKYKALCDGLLTLLELKISALLFLHVSNEIVFIKSMKDT